MEEFLIRGFLYRGWSESFLGPIGAIVLTAAVWAMTHTQYDVYGKLEIFGMGLALGYCRWRSNSTWPTVMIHSALNTFIFFVTGPYVLGPNGCDHDWHVRDPLRRDHHPEPAPVRRQPSEGWRMPAAPSSAMI
ncbi:hypothetical protein ACVWZM_007893 [Bradyrhizobium sp. USDA 4501]|uniref:CPBP family intramembrane glutamic endopeptidase n=1 Tax=Bradyrhizobium brasilense TaxID=1419277 RepID=UPI0009784D03|nr:hypothetical protein BSN85_36985 [Bradyrhizobium brasilense]